jgi:hypothetical protein
MPVQAAASPVIPHGSARIGVRGGFLHVTQRYSGIECSSDKCMPKRVGRNDLGDPSAAGGLADDPPGAVPVQPPSVRGEEHRPFGAFADGQVDRPSGPWRQRTVTTLPPLRVIVNVRVTALQA